MNQRYMMLSWFCVHLVLVSACDRDNLQGGIEGSGITTPPLANAKGITTSGEVTALGSVFVNDVEYDLVGATITIDGFTARESDLALGQVTIVEGELAAGSSRGTAKRVTVETPIAGQISAVDTALRRVTILGQTIEIDAGTIIEDRVDDRPLGGLDVGREVAVSGFADSTGMLHATRIDERRPATPLLITGRVADLNTSARTFSINGQVVAYGTAALRGFASPTEGATVRVVARNLDRGTLVADEVGLRAEGLPGEPGAAAALQGWITRFESVDDFDVDGRRVVVQSSADNSVVRLDAFVSVRGSLIAGGVVEASDIRAVLPGRLTGDVTIAGVDYGLTGLMTPEGVFRLNIEEWSGGPPVLDSGLGQLVGNFIVNGRTATGIGVLIGETCAPPSAGRFCGMETAVRIELTKDGLSVDRGSTGVIRVAAVNGEEVWPMRLAYWGGQAGFDGAVTVGYAPGVYKLRQAEFIQASDVLMTVYSDGRLFFQSAETGCTGNGAFSNYVGRGINVQLKIEGCNASFGYLNADFEGLSTQESLTPWGYDFSVLNIRVSTPPGATVPAAITFWGSSLY